MTIELGPNRYGKSAIRLVKVVREPERHHVRDLTVDIALEGDFAPAHVEGDNSAVVATDTMKNTTYALAADHLRADTPIETFGLQLARRFCGNAQVASAVVSIREHAWQRMPTAGGPSADAFSRGGAGTRRARVTVDRNDHATFEAGVDELTVMKTRRSAFEGFPRDEYTTLAETDDRILATKLEATWRYASEIDFDVAYEGVLGTLLEVFAQHHSPSVQASIWICGRAILERHPDVAEVSMRLPNLHHWVVDLRPFGLDNRREVFVATTEPYGLIEATVRRAG